MTTIPAACLSSYPARALRIAKLPVVSHAVVQSMPLAEAHAKLLPFFEEISHLNPTCTPKWFLTPRGMVKGLLTRGQAKLEKALPVPGLIAGLSLAPADAAGPTVCAFSNEACRLACIAETGQYRFTYPRALRIAKTRALRAEPVAFLRMLQASLEWFARLARKQSKTAFVRLNVLSDIPWEDFCPGLLEHFSDGSSAADEVGSIRFYDYTKIPGRQTPSNYHLTFSRSGTNDMHVETEMARGMAIAVVFATRDKENLPATWRGRPVVNGDKHDARPLDPKGAIVGLSYKLPATGATMEDCGAFLVKV